MRSGCQDRTQWVSSVCGGGRGAVCCHVGCVLSCWVCVAGAAAGLA